MSEEIGLYTKYNPLLIQPSFALPKEVAVIGAGTIGPDIGYYLKSALPGIKLYLVSKDTIITSNTSSIPADRIFNKMKNPGRATITHFFAPAWRSLPVEVIRWEKARREVVDYLFWFFCRTGKAPMITGNAICFMLDRIFDNWCNEAAYLLQDATAGQIDKVAE